MAINLAEDAVHALNRAAAVAAREGGESIAPRHILAGALSQRDPALLDALTELELDLEALAEPMRDAPETYEGHLPFTQPGHEVLAAAIEAGSATGADATGSAHLLLGVAKAGDDESRAVLREWGLEEDALAAALTAEPSDDSHSGTATTAVVTALLLALALSCTSDAGSGDPSAEADDPAAATATADPAAANTPDPFAATPADGPPPEIGPAPDDYVPTAVGAPSTDIWVGRLERGPDGALSVADILNATDRDGYDNQPSFDPTGAALYYTAALDATQTETFRYDIASGAVEQVTRTPGASEFSPTFIPRQDAFSAIHETRGLQYLWRYGTDGTEMGAIFATVEPVGYHAWADERTAAMFVLGDPPTLQVGDALSGEVRTVAENPGRSIHRIPGTAEISFVRKVSDEEWWIERLDPASRTTERIAQTLPGREDYAWTPAGEIMMGDGTALFAWTADSGWGPVSELGDTAGDISRLAVSADGSHIAVVRNR